MSSTERFGRRLLPIVSLALAGLLTAGCSGDQAATEPPPDAGGTTAEPLLYVRVGASETYGAGADDPLRESWTQVLFRTALPRNASFVNLGVPGATVGDALEQEAPVALELKPDIVTVWLNVNDIFAGVGPRTYRRRLTTLLNRLRRGGATRVLVANTPALDNLPAYRACLEGEGTASGPCPLDGQLPRPEELNRIVRAYNRSVAAAASESGAEVVDLHERTLLARRAGTEPELIATDGFHPSTQGHRAVARVFAAELGELVP